MKLPIIDRSLAFLGRVPLFKSLNQQQLQNLADLTITRTFSRGSVIIVAEDEGDAFFIIRKGRVKVNILHGDGREVILSILGKGEVFGELALLDGRPRSANVITLEETELITLRRSEFLQLMNNQPAIIMGLLDELVSRLRKTDHQIGGLALLDATSRISRTLVRLAAEHGVETAAGVLVAHKITHQQLANMSGTTRETVTRVLKRLESQGYITMQGRQILIHPDIEQDDE